MRKHILMIVQNLPVPFDRRVWQEATSLQQAGYDVTVICPKKGKHTGGFEHLQGIDIFRYPLLYEAGQGALGYFVEFAWCWLATAVLSLRVRFKRKFNVIHACNPPETYFLLGLFYRPFGVKFVFDHHDLSPEMYLAKKNSKKGFLYRGLLRLERWTMKTAHAIIEVNESHRDIAIDRGGASPDIISIVRSGPRREWATPIDETPEFRNGKKHLVVYLGEMCEQDGVDYLLRAIKIYKDTYENDTQFALIGGGPDQERMRNLAEELDLRDMVNFTGRISDEDLIAYLSTADVCADPDPWTEWSNMSTMNKIIEYMAFGCPVVAFDLKEHRFTAQNGAVFVEPNDEQKFSSAIRDTLLNEDYRNRISKQNRERFLETLSWENSEKLLLDAYDQLFISEVIDS